MKLHLGCGERYLVGYVNIDYPASKHSVQKETVADKFADIRSLKYPSGSIEEIRLHHVFEHFPRATACALLAVWNNWLVKGGVLRIEVPDLEKMAKNISSRLLSKRRKFIAERHIFGSQEAPWATHFAGYTPSMLVDLVKMYGYQAKKIKKNSWKGTSNVEVFATKIDSGKTAQEFEKITRKYLGQFLLPASESERKLLDIWMNSYRDQMKKCFK